MGIWKSNTKRVFGSWGFPVAICIVAVGCVLGGRDVSLYIESGTYGAGETEIFLLCQGVLISDAFRLSVPLACTLPVGALFLDEFQSRFAVYSLIRTTWRHYILSKVIVTFLGGGVAVLSGALGGITVNLIRLSLGLESWSVFFQGGVSQGLLILYYFTGVLLAGGTWALAGSIAAAVIRNIYMAYAVPFIFYYILNTFQRRYYKSAWVLNPGEWMVARFIPLWQGLLLSLVFCVLLMAVYSKVMEKRLGHG